MCWGSHISFYFDYGDGTVEFIEGAQELGYSSYYGIGQHAYTSGTILNFYRIIVSVLGQANITYGI